MELGVSIQILWPLAADEATAACAEEIEPGHVFCAALKVAELDPSLFRNALPKQELVARLEEDLPALNSALEQMGIRIPEGSTPFRREIRVLRRKDNRRAPKNQAGAVLHRSADTKAIFALAEAAARDSGESDLRVGRVVTALFTHPDEALARALAQLGDAYIEAQPRSAEGATDWIDAFGFDLTQQAREEDLGGARLSVIRRDAVCRVLADTLFASKGKPRPALLVSGGERTVAATVRDLAAWLVSSEPPAGIRRGRVFEIDSAVVLDRHREGTPEGRLDRVFRHAADWKSSILFFDNFHRYLARDLAGDGLPRRFRGLLKDTGTGFVMGLAQKQYERNADALAEWRDVFKMIRIHDVNPNFQL